MHQVRAELLGCVEPALRSARRPITAVEVVVVAAAAVLAEAPVAAVD